MTSRNGPSEAYAWIWLPHEVAPVVAGLLTRVGKQLLFNYGKSYLKRNNAIAIYEPELPLQPGDIPLHEGLSMPSCIRDASPDAWGQRVIINRKLSLKGQDASKEEQERTNLSAGIGIRPDWRSGLSVVRNQICSSYFPPGNVR